MIIRFFIVLAQEKIGYLHKNLPIHCKPVQNKAAEVKVVDVGNTEDDIEMEE